MDVNEALLSIIDELYAGVFDSSRAMASLERIGHLVGANGGVLYLMHETEQRITHAVLSNFDLDSHREFGDAHAEQGHYYRRMPTGLPVHMHALWPIDKMKKTAFYHDVLQKQDVLYGAGTLILRKPGLHGMMVLNRSERAGPFSQPHFEMLRVLAPHLNRVLRITQEMGAIAQERGVFASALDSLSLGVVLTDWRGKLLHLNRAAERMIELNDGLAIRAGRFVATDNNENKLMGELIMNATGHGLQGRFRDGGSCRISRSSSGGLPWLLLLAPCGDVPANALSPPPPACMIFIHDPAARSCTTAEQLRQLFGLTGQESKVLLLAAEGHGTRRVAEEMGLSSLTVRNHLHRVFAKTDTRRQADLARLVGGLSIDVARRSTPPETRNRSHRAHVPDSLLRLSGDAVS